MKFIKSMYKTSIIFSIILFILGLLLLVNPEGILHAISYTIGVILIVWGIIPILSFFSNKERETYLEFNFVIGVFALIFGLIVMLNPNMVGSIIPVLISIWMIINGISKLSYALSLNESKSTISIIIPLIILVCGIILIFNPFEGAKAFTKLLGIFLIIYSILDIVECFSIKKAVKAKDKIKKDNKKVIEAVYEEE